LEADSMSDGGWHRLFDEPIQLPDGGELRTFLEAGRYLEALPESQREQPEWQTAIHFLLRAAEGRLPVMFAHVALLKALNAGKPKPTASHRKRTKINKIIW
jgi:hypothetical protein